jgi:hypothetical protein
LVAGQDEGSKFVNKHVKPKLKSLQISIWSSIHQTFSNAAIPMQVITLTTLFTPGLPLSSYLP